MAVTALAFPSASGSRDTGGPVPQECASVRDRQGDASRNQGRRSATTPITMPFMRRRLLMNIGVKSHARLGHNGRLNGHVLRVGGRRGGSHVGRGPGG